MLTDISIWGGILICLIFLSWLMSGFDTSPNRILLKINTVSCISASITVALTYYPLTQPVLLWAQTGFVLTAAITQLATWLLDGESDKTDNSDLTPGTEATIESTEENSEAIYWLMLLAMTLPVWIAVVLGGMQLSDYFL